MFKCIRFFCFVNLKRMSTPLLNPAPYLKGEFTNVINHDTVKDLLGLTMLVYDYSKSFSLENDETIENFVSKNMDSDDEELDLDVTDERKDALNQLSKTSPKGKVVKFVSDPVTDIQAGITVSETNKRITVIFRGSESKSDWYYDLMVLKKRILKENYDDVYVHSGFYKQLHDTDVYSQLTDTLSELKDANPEYDIYITGHSLGAALSTLFGFEIAHKFEEKINVISFASPRVGNKGFRKAFDEKDNLLHYRITNDRDIVTAGPMILFQHVGKNIALSDSKCCIFHTYDYNEWWKFSLFNCWRVSDHNVDLYYERLCKHKW